MSRLAEEYIAAHPEARKYITEHPDVRTAYHYLEDKWHVWNKKGPKLPRDEKKVTLNEALEGLTHYLLFADNMQWELIAISTLAARKVNIAEGLLMALD